MKHRKWMLLAVALLAGCGDENANPVEPRRAQLDASVTTASTVPFALTAPHPCQPGTIVTLTGTLHFEFKTHFDSAGGLHVKLHANPQDVTGSDTNGVTYHAHGATNQSILIKANAADENTFVNTINVRGSEKDTSFVIHEVVHITVNANGEVTAVVVKSDLKCN